MSPGPARHGGWEGWVCSGDGQSRQCGAGRQQSRGGGWWGHAGETPVSVVGRGDTELLRTPLSPSGCGGRCASPVGARACVRRRLHTRGCEGGRCASPRGAGGAWRPAGLHPQRPWGRRKGGLRCTELPSCPARPSTGQGGPPQPRVGFVGLTSLSPRTPAVTSSGSHRPAESPGCWGRDGAGSGAGGCEGAGLSGQATPGAWAAGRGCGPGAGLARRGRVLQVGGGAAGLGGGARLRGVSPDRAGRGVASVGEGA